ncbi:unnamed protein product [marine sediment metagenome]|uniref:Rubrerythrin diiron-binding domain-containing protein n=1 Tax=marine sediment metagenome TaxID=412755 RepID=X0RYZ1_9ZZZZ
MVKTNINAITALKMAIQLEIDSYQLYSDASSAARNENSRGILRLLAEEGYSHKKRLEKLYTELSGRRILALNVKPKLKRREIVSENVSPIEVLEVAIENEKEDLKFYRTAEERTRSLDGKRMFRRLIQEEENHLELLEMEYKVRKINFPCDGPKEDELQEVSQAMN